MKKFSMGFCPFILRPEAGCLAVSLSFSTSAGLECSLQPIGASLDVHKFMWKSSSATRSREVSGIGCSIGDVPVVALNVTNVFTRRKATGLRTTAMTFKVGCCRYDSVRLFVRIAWRRHVVVHLSPLMLLFLCHHSKTAMSTVVRMER